MQWLIAKHTYIQSNTNIATHQNVSTNLLSHTFNCSYQTNKIKTKKKLNFILNVYKNAIKIIKNRHPKLKFFSITRQAFIVEGIYSQGLLTSYNSIEQFV